MSYQETKQWKELRAELIEESNGSCRVCNSTDSLTLHHRYYTDDPYLKDSLTVLCSSCHMIFHQSQWNGKSSQTNRNSPHRKKYSPTPPTAQELQQVERMVSTEDFTNVVQYRKHKRIALEALRAGLV